MPSTAPVLLPANDIVNYAAAAPGAHTWYVKYTNNTAATQTVALSVPMGVLETTRSWSSTDTGVSGNGATGAAGIYDTLTVTAAGTVTYTIASTYTLASGRTFGTNTNQATFAITSGATYRRFQVVALGAATASTYQKVVNRTARDAVLVLDQLLTRETTLAEMQDVYDWIENTDPDFVQLRRQASMTGNIATVSTAVDYVVKREDVVVLETGNSKTISMPRPELHPGRFLMLRATGTTNVIDFGGGSVDGGSTGATVAATQNKTLSYISNGTTWLTFAVQA